MGSNTLGWFGVGIGTNPFAEGRNQLPRQSKGKGVEQLKSSVKTSVKSQPELIWDFFERLEELAFDVKKPVVGCRKQLTFIVVQDDLKMKLARLVMMLVAFVGLVVGCGKSEGPAKNGDDVENVVQDMNIPKTPENSGSDSEK